MKQQRGGWVLKVVIGIAIIGVLLAGLVAWQVHRSIQMAKRELPKMLNARIQQLEKSNKVSPEDLAILKEMHGMAQRQESSFLAMTIAGPMLIQIAQDDAITSGERKQLIAVRDFLVSKNGNIGMKEMREFYQNNPEMKAYVEELQAKAKQQQGKQ